jgi:hypothetical protein
VAVAKAAFVDGEREVAEVGLSEDRADHRSDQVDHQCVDKGGECGPHDERDGQCDQVSRHEETLEVVQEL